MDADTLYKKLRHHHNDGKIDEFEKELLSNISDYSIFNTKDILETALTDCSLEFLETVVNKLKSIPKRKSLLENAMYFYGGENRPLILIKMLETGGYKITDAIASNLVRALCAGNIIDDENHPDFNKFMECIKYLIDKGADLNEADHRGKGSTPLMYSFMQLSPAVTKALIGLGADPNASNSLGDTPLLIACGKPMIASCTIPENEETVKIVQILLDSGADINYKLGKSQTPLYWAKRTKRQKAQAILNEYINET